MIGTIFLVILSGVVGGGEEATEPPRGEDIFGVSIQDLRSLVTDQPFVSSCQYAIVKTQSMYRQAKAQCSRRLDKKGKIAVIRNEQENQAIHSLFIATFGHGTDASFLRSNPTNYIWIGLTRDNEYTETWQWDSDPTTPVNYTNWKQGYPKGGTSARMNRNGFWESTTNIVQHPAACQGPSKYVVFKKRLDYQLAYDVCTNMSMTLAKIVNQTENEELVRAAARSLGSPYNKNINRNFEHINQVWIGGYQDEDDGKLKWEDGSLLTYRNFEPYYGLEFHGTGNVRVSIDKIRKDWKLEKATEERSFACQCPNPGKDNLESSSTLPDEDQYSTIQAVKGNNDCKSRFYGFAMQETHLEAQMTCKRKGLQLARINNADENEYAVRLMNKINKGIFSDNLYDGINWFWIGASDDSVEGFFQWEDGSPVLYSKWGKDQPDNAHPIRGGQNKVSVYRGTGHWDDAHRNSFRSFLCYDHKVSFREEKANGCGVREDVQLKRPKPDDSSLTETSTESSPKKDTDELIAGKNRGGSRINDPRDCIQKEYEGEYYVSSNTKFYDDAKLDCESRNMMLATILNPETNKRLLKLALRKIHVSGYVMATLGEFSYFWVGLEINEKQQMNWIDDDRIMYDNFRNYDKRYAYSIENGVDVVGVNKADGFWEWKPRTNRYMYICQEPKKWSCTLQ